MGGGGVGGSLHTDDVKSATQSPGWNLAVNFAVGSEDVTTVPAELIATVVSGIAVSSRAKSIMPNVHSLEAPEMHSYVPPCPPAGVNPDGKDAVSLCLK